MKLQEFLSYFSNTLVVEKKENMILIVDDYHRNHKEYDDGTWVSFTNRDELNLYLNNGQVMDLIPDIYIDGEIDFLFNEDFKNEYGMSRTTLKKIECEMNIKGFDKLDHILLKHGQLKAYENLKDICAVLRGEIKLTVDHI